MTRRFKLHGFQSAYIYSFWYEVIKKLTLTNFAWIKGRVQIELRRAFWTVLFTADLICVRQNKSSMFNLAPCCQLPYVWSNKWSFVHSVKAKLGLTTVYEGGKVVFVAGRDAILKYTNPTKIWLQGLDFLGGISVCQRFFQTKREFTWLGLVLCVSRGLTWVFENHLQCVAEW